MTNFPIAGAIAIVMALVALFYKSKSEKAISAHYEDKAKVEDAPLAAKQEEIKEKIHDVDIDIEKLKQERADKWKK